MDICVVSECVVRENGKKDGTGTQVFRCQKRPLVKTYKEEYYYLIVLLIF